MEKINHYKKSLMFFCVSVCFSRPSIVNFTQNKYHDPNLIFKISISKILHLHKVMKFLRNPNTIGS